MQKAQISLQVKQALAAIKKRPPSNLDRLVQSIHHKVFEDINCLDCGECCKGIPAMVTRNDMMRLAKALQMKPADFVEKYLIKDNDGDLVIKGTPCPFLGSDNYCSVYEDRPFACREYPHTDRRRFHQLIDVSIKNASFCPAVYKILNTLVEKLNKD